MLKAHCGYNLHAPFNFVFVGLSPLRYLYALHGLLCEDEVGGFQGVVLRVGETEEGLKLGDVRREAVRRSVVGW